MGTLTVPEKSDPLVFLAEGIGVTPFYSMLRFISQKNILTQVHLIATFEKVNDCIFYEELLELTKIQSNISITYSLLQKSTEWKGAYGPISKKLLEKHIPLQLSTYTFYIVGSSGFVEKFQI